MLVRAYVDDGSVTKRSVIFNLDNLETIQLFHDKEFSENNITSIRIVTPTFNYIGQEPENYYDLCPDSVENYKEVVNKIFKWLAYKKL